MILQSLDRYYNHLYSEKDSTGKPKIPTYGFSEEKLAGLSFYHLMAIGLTSNRI
jgi:hypothetical protein